jgi:hypothetical protein
MDQRAPGGDDLTEAAIISVALPRETQRLQQPLRVRAH